MGTKASRMLGRRRAGGGLWPRQLGAARQGNPRTWRSMGLQLGLGGQVGTRADVTAGPYPPPEGTRCREDVEVYGHNEDTCAVAQQCHRECAQ